MKLDRICLAASLVLMIFMLAGCIDLMDIFIGSQIRSQAEEAGIKADCPPDKPYRVGGVHFSGVCIDKEALDAYTAIKIRGTKGEEKDFIKIQSALDLGEKKDCPPDKPYYVKKLLLFGDCVSASEFADTLTSDLELDETDSEEPECKTDSDCKDGSCIDGKCTENESEEEECRTDLDCFWDERCEDGKCITPKCTKKAKYCASPMVLEYCDGDGTLVRKDCEFGCDDGKCMTKDEKTKNDEKEEKKGSCKENHAKCITQYSIEYCTDGKKSTGFCQFGCQSNHCIGEKEDVLGDINKDIKEKQDFIDYLKGPYMGALDLKIKLLGDDDPKKKGLEEYKTFLGDLGTQFEDATTTLKGLEQARKIFLDNYDPSMAVENMDVAKILDKGLAERLGDLWKDMTHWGKKSPEQIEQEGAEDQLKVYKAMLEKEKENDFLKKDRKDRLGSVMANAIKGYAADKIKEKTKEAVEAAAGTAFSVIGIADTAITTVKDEAKNMMFTGLIKAYNRRRALLEDSYPKKSNEEIHKLAVEQIEDLPYADAKTGVIIAKYGNLLANKDCTEKGNKNPLCIDRKVFWIAMDRSYEHQNQDKLFRREVAK